MAILLLVSLGCVLSLFSVAWSVKVEGFEKYPGMQCMGTEADILRDFEGTAEECQDKCIDLEGCVGFVRVNSGSVYAGKCYFRGGVLSDPIQYNGDDRDCYTPVRFKKFAGKQCWGSGPDILRDFEGNACECAQKCVDLDECVGFIRVNSGSEFAEKCYFRGGILGDPEEYNGDDRDCYAPVGDGPSNKVYFAKNDGDQCTGSKVDILRDFEGTQAECRRKCVDLDGCVGFVRVNKGSQFAGKCYFRAGSLTDPVPYNGDNRDCFEPVFYSKYIGSQCTGSTTDILRDFVGTERECKRKCSNLDECVGFVRVNSGSTFAGKCYFRGGRLSDPTPFSGDNRDCYETVKFTKYPGNQCWGSTTDILRDFEGTPFECQQKCADLTECVGFVRVNSGSQYAGKCFFRGGVLEDPYQYDADVRDCYVANRALGSVIPAVAAHNNIPDEINNNNNNDYFDEEFIKQFYEMKNEMDQNNIELILYFIMMAFGVSCSMLCVYHKLVNNKATKRAKYEFVDQEEVVQINQ